MLRSTLLALVLASGFAPAAGAVITLKTGVIRTYYTSDAAVCTATNVSGHQVQLSAMRMKSATNATVASLPSMAVADGRTVTLTFSAQQLQVRCEADITASDAAGLRLRIYRLDSGRGSVDGDSAAPVERAFPRWDTKINDPSRFQVLDGFGGAAVLDLETGLVWEKSPETNPISSPVIWVTALRSCTFLLLGERRGWRLPTIQELGSLVDSTQSAPPLPSGHPFTNVVTQSGETYWSSTPDLGQFDNRFTQSFSGTGDSFVSDDPSGSNHVWCVRGGQGAYSPLP